ncbi:MAG: asparagine synthase-related protein [Chloroflexota bacterium]|nr:asparagine synthase-related protein [Chloroflexota bacterium]
MSKRGNDVAKRMIDVLNNQCSNKNSSIALSIGDRTFNGALKDLNVKAIKGTIGLGCVGMSKTRHASIHWDCFNKLAVIYDGIIYNFKEKLSKEHDLIATTDADIIAHLLEENYNGDLYCATKKVVVNLEGGFAIAATDGNAITAIRDPVGFRTLYYGENDDFYAFATLKKALWRIGIPRVSSLKPGNIITLSEYGMDVSKVFPEDRFGATIDIKDKNIAINEYQETLNTAVQKTLEGIDKAGILLSGGVDSCLLAKVLSDQASKSGVQLTAYNLGMEGSPDSLLAENFARETGLPLRKKTVTIGELDKALPQVIRSVEERDFVQIETSLIPYMALEMAARDSIRKVFVGQGPDELWGGYPWYPLLLDKWGYAKLYETMWEDLIRGDTETLARENKVAQTFDIELRYPFLDPEVIKIAMRIAPQLKVYPNKDDLGKHIHRGLATRLGIPDYIAKGKKAAAQHGSGIHNALIQVANEHGFNDKLVSRLHYTPDTITAERLGSSSRYGYQYGDQHMWQVPRNVQLYFDYVAYHQGLLDESKREKIAATLGGFRPE